MSAPGKRLHPRHCATVVALALAAASPAWPYAGIGRAAVEAANGTVPETVEALESTIRELEAAGASVGAEASYRLAILNLNRPRGVGLEEPRRILARAIVSDPGYKDALTIWLDLMPPTDELRDMEQALSGLPESAGQAWARANVAHLQGKADDASSAAEIAERLDPAYRGRSRWLQAVIAGERKDDAAATRLLEETLATLDAATEAVVWANALLIASPEESERHKSALSEDAQDFFRSFWKRRDVFPLTETNERLGEHFRRLAKARQDYPLRTNGYGYFTTHDEFKESSPDLPVYSSDVVYDYQERVSPWLDHRGLVFVRHGEPDRSVRSSQGQRAETWLYFRLSSRPLLFHFVVRRGVGEYVLTLNLAQALAVGNIADDPKLVLQNTGDFRDTYQSRSIFHQVFQRIAISRSSYELQDLLEQEAGLMASYIREVWYDDTNTLIKKDDILPFAFHNVNFRGTGGNVDAYFYYALPEKEIKTTDPNLAFDSTIVLYSDKWDKRIASTEDHFSYQKPAGKKADKRDLLRGKMVLKDVPPGRYNFAFQVTERASGKIGIAKGRFVADYFGPEFIEMSDLLLAARPSAAFTKPEAVTATFERGGVSLIPEATRTLEKAAAAEIYFEIYDLTAGADGQSHYRVEYRILQIQQEPSVVEKILGFSMNIAGAFFPYEIFLARAGLFGLGVAAANPTKGLDVEVQERTTPATGVVTEVYPLASKKYPPGIYQVYVTVKDYGSGSIATRSVRFAVD